MSGVSSVTIRVSLDPESRSPTVKSTLSSTVRQVWVTLVSLLLTEPSKGPGLTGDYLRPPTPFRTHSSATIHFWTPYSYVIDPLPSTSVPRPSTDRRRSPSFRSYTVRGSRPSSPTRYLDPSRPPRLRPLLPRHTLLVPALGRSGVSGQCPKLK